MRPSTVPVFFLTAALLAALGLSRPVLATPVASAAAAFPSPRMSGPPQAQGTVRTIDPAVANAPVATAPATRVRVPLYVGQVRVIDTPLIVRVAIGNSRMVGITTLANQLVMIPQTPGVTDVYVWHRDGAQVDYHLVIQPDDVQGVFAEVRATAADFPGVKVEQRGGQVLLTGSLSPLQAKALGVAVRRYPDVVDLVSGDAVHMRRMVELDVQVVNFNKTALDNLGINWQQGIIGPAAGLVGDSITNNLYRLGDVTQGGGTASNTLNGPGGPLTSLPLRVTPYSAYLGLVTTISSQINVAVTNGQAYILANPRLITRSGQTASFLAGGEVPIPVTSFGGTSVTYKNYGVKLNIAPQVDAQGNILANIKTSLSQIDPTITVNGYPGFLTRRTNAVVNVRSGQTIVLSGLVNTTGSDNISKFPWLGNIPVLGALFRSTQFQRNQSELVIFVTPHIITPASPRNLDLIRQARGYEQRFNRDFAHGYFMPGVGHDPNQVPYPAFPKSPQKVPRKAPPAPARAGSSSPPPESKP